MQNTWSIGRSCKRREAFRRAVLIGRALAPILPQREWRGLERMDPSLRSPCGPQGRPGSGMRARAPCMSATTEAGITRSHSALGSYARLRRKYCSARRREDRASRSCRALPHINGPKGLLFFVVPFYGMSPCGLLQASVHSCVFEFPKEAPLAFWFIRFTACFALSLTSCCLMERLIPLLHFAVSF